MYGTAQTTTETAVNFGSQGKHRIEDRVSHPIAQPQLKVLVVDDHGIVRDGLTIMLERQTGLKVVGVAGTGQEAIVAARRLEPDVIIMDLLLPDLNGVEVSERILRLLPRTHIIVLSACHGAEHVHRAFRVGVHGYIVKDGVSAEFAGAVKTVLAGGRYSSPQLNFNAPSGDGSAAKSPLEKLSGREREVLCGVVAGASSAEIAERLSLSRKTVDTYRGRLMVKLGVANRTALIRFAIEHEYALG
jgi:DNA-binding NarL/FixJ family response regulator